MIQVDIVLAITVLLSFSLAVVFVLWMFYNSRGGKDNGMSDSSDQVQQCPYCTHVFVNYKPKDVLMCPKCKSYIAE